MELQSASDNAKYYSNFLSSSSHNSSSSARGLLSISPYGWEIDGDLNSVYRASTYFSCLVSTNHTTSLSCGPPPSSSGQISAALTGSPDHNDMQWCQLLIIPRMYHVIVSPWQRVWWASVWYTLLTFLSQNLFQIHGEHGLSSSVKGLHEQNVENCFSSFA